MCGAGATWRTGQPHATVEIKLIARLRKHSVNPKFKELGERLEKIREKHEQGLLSSLEFLKAILEIAKDTIEAEKQTDPEEEQDQALAALTELFNEVKSKNTHVIVERIVAGIDGIVRHRAAGPFRWLADDNSRRTRSSTRPPAIPSEIQAAHGPGAV